VKHALILALLLSGCPKAGPVLSWGEPPPLPDLSVLAPPAGEPEAEPLQAGDPAPWDGVLLAPGEASYYLASEEMLARAVGALQNERRGHLGDLAEAAAEIEERDSRWMARIRLQRDVLVAGGIILSAAACAIGFGAGMSVSP
jgi:hypothetical protein